MKNTMKNLIFGFLALAFVLGLSSCGDKSEDPVPQKSNLELVKESIVGSYLNFESIKMTKGADVVTYNGECNESSYPTWVQANVANVDFNFINQTEVDIKVPCQSLNLTDETYTVSEVSGKIRIKTSNGYDFELITVASDMDGSTVLAKRLDGLVQGATEAIWTFSK